MLSHEIIVNLMQKYPKYNNQNIGEKKNCMMSDKVKVPVKKNLPRHLITLLWGNACPRTHAHTLSCSEQF